MREPRENPPDGRVEEPLDDPGDGRGAGRAVELEVADGVVVPGRRAAAPPLVEPVPAPGVGRAALVGRGLVGAGLGRALAPDAGRLAAGAASKNSSNENESM